MSASPPAMPKAAAASVPTAASAGLAPAQFVMTPRWPEEIDYK